MASVAGTLGGFGQASYSTTKAGVLGLTRTLAMEGGRHGITCNAIVPGVIGTEAFHLANPAMNQRIVDRTVFKRPGEPQDVANAIAFLCSDLAVVHHRRRAERLRRRRALRLLTFGKPGRRVESSVRCAPSRQSFALSRPAVEAAPSCCAAAPSSLCSGSR